MAKFNKKLSPLVKRQLPQHIQANNPLLAEFIKQYYVFMDSAQITLSSVTASDQILLETAAEGFIALDGTDEKKSNVLVSFLRAKQLQVPRLVRQQQYWQKIQTILKFSLLLIQNLLLAKRLQAVHLVLKVS